MKIFSKHAPIHALRPRLSHGRFICKSPFRILVKCPLYAAFPCQVVARFEGGCPGGSRLGVLCRPTLVWQPNLEGSGEGGYLFLVDTQAQAVTRQMNLGGGSLGASMQAQLGFDACFYWACLLHKY